MYDFWEIGLPFTTTTTTEAPILTPISKEEMQKRRTDYIRLVIISIGLIVILIVALKIGTKGDEPYESPYIKNQIDSLAKVNAELQNKLTGLDSTLKAYEDAIIELDTRLQGIHDKKKSINNYYTEKRKKTVKYTNEELDNFFKDRYNY